MKRILIADDHDTVRAGLRAVLQQRTDWAVVAEATDGTKATAAAIENRPDVAILDFSMPRMTGIEVARRIRNYPLKTEILIFTVHNSGLLAKEAFEAGAMAFLTKSDASKLLIAAVDSLLLHRPFLTERSGNGLSVWPLSHPDKRAPLTAREQLVVKLVADGYSNKSISAILGLSVKTTESHRAAAMRKLDVNSTAGLVRYAVRAALVEA